MFYRYLPVIKRTYIFSEAAITHVRAYHPPAHHKPPTMDDLPVPQGSWKAQHDANQARYNIHLIGGITFLAVTVGFIAKSGILDFNFFPPTLTDEEMKNM